MITKIQNPVGMTFNWLTVLSLADKTDKEGCRYWNCRCRCGNTAIIRHSKEYRTWKAILSRCYNPKDKCYKYYGGRGITICQEWKSDYWKFVKNMGRKPGANYSIERRDSNGSYSKSNCHWATAFEQAANKRSNINLTLGAETKCVAEWARVLGVKQITLYDRVNRGWSDEDILTTPIRGHSV